MTGDEVSEQRAEATISAALQGPFNFIDTSNNYGGGAAERGQRVEAELAQEGGEEGGVAGQRLRADERTKLVPTVILTSSSEDEDMLKSYKHGANSYVRKPVEFGALVNAVGQLGVYWMLINQSPPR